MGRKRQPKCARKTASLLNSFDFHQAIARVADHDIDPAKRGPGAIDYATGDEPIEDVRETLDF